jgi:hypothetical protein
MKLHSKPEIKELLRAEVFRTTSDNVTRYATLDTQTGVMIFFYGDSGQENTFEISVGDDRQRIIRAVRKLMFAEMSN